MVEICTMLLWKLFVFFLRGEIDLFPLPGKGKDDILGTQEKKYDMAKVKRTRGTRRGTQKKVPWHKSKNGFLKFEYS